MEDQRSATRVRVRVRDNKPILEAAGGGGAVAGRNRGSNESVGNGDARSDHSARNWEMQ